MNILPLALRTIYHNSATHVCTLSPTLALFQSTMIPEAQDPCFAGGSALAHSNSCSVEDGWDQGRQRDLHELPA